MWSDKCAELTRMHEECERRCAKAEEESSMLAIALKRAAKRASDFKGAGTHAHSLPEVIAHLVTELTNEHAQSATRRR